MADPYWTQVEYKSLVEEVEGTDVDEKQEHPAYPFSRKTFYEDDQSGVYGDE